MQTGVIMGRTVTFGLRKNHGHYERALVFGEIPSPENAPDGVEWRVMEDLDSYPSAVINDRRRFKGVLALFAEKVNTWIVDNWGADTSGVNEAWVDSILKINADGTGLDIR